MELVNSSSVVRVGHDQYTNDLVIEYTNGNRYMYADVPENVFDSLLVAKSVGQFVNTQIKPKYLYSKV